MAEASCTSVARRGGCRISPDPMSRRTNAAAAATVATMAMTKRRMRRDEVERSAGSDRARLVEQREHGDVGERRAMDARPPEAVEQEHEQQQHAPGGRSRPEVADELCHEESEAVARERQPPQRCALPNQPGDVRGCAGDEASQPSGSARDECDLGTQHGKEHASRCEQAQARNPRRQPRFHKPTVLIATHCAACTEDTPGGEDDHQEPVAAPLQVSRGRVRSNRQRQQPVERGAEDGDRVPERHLCGVRLARDDGERRAVDEHVEDAEVGHRDQPDALQAQQQARRHHCL